MSIAQNSAAATIEAAWPHNQCPIETYQMLELRET
jgi:hypothetical protein